MLFDKVLVPVDLSEVSEEQVKDVAKLVPYGLKEAIILYVSSNEQATPEEREDLSGLVGLLDGIRVHPMVAKGKPASVILKVAKKERATMIAMASSGKTKTQELVVGSVSLAV